MWSQFYYSVVTQRTQNDQVGKFNHDGGGINNKNSPQNQTYLMFIFYKE